MTSNVRTQQLATHLLVAAFALVAISVGAPGRAAAQEGDEPVKVKTLDPVGEGAGKVEPVPTEGGEPVEGEPGAGVEGAQGAAVDGGDGVNYDMRVRELEEKVNDLKEKIFRSKSRLVLLKETVLRGNLSGSKAVIVHLNEMGSSFLLEQAVYSLDGNQIFNELDQDASLSDKEKFEIFNGAIVPGNHNISVMLIYRGNGFGVFSYLQGYKFTIRSSYTFTAEEGKTTKVQVIGYEKGGVTTALEDRPNIKYEIEFFDDNEGASAQKSE